MKCLIGLFIIFALITTCFAETYSVEVDKKYVPYLEKEHDNVATWLGLQAVNSAQRRIAEDYEKIKAKTYDDKITELEK